MSARARLSDNRVALEWVRQPQPAAGSIDNVNIEVIQQFVTVKRLSIGKALPELQAVSVTPLKWAIGP